MKRRLALIVLLCMLVLLTSCTAASHGVGKAKSLYLLDAAQSELEKNVVGQVERLDEGAVAEYKAGLVSDGVVLAGALTGVLRVTYDREYGNLLTEMIGFEDMEDAEVVATYFQKKYATELAEGKARVTQNGYVLTVTCASFVLG